MTVRILHGDCRQVLATLPEASVHSCVTSPPYFGLRDYGVDGQIGLEQTPAAYVAELVAVFREVHRVLRDDGTLWLNLGDSYAGSWGARGRGQGTNAARPELEMKHGTSAPARHGFADIGVKPKDLIGIPWRVAFALQADGWYLRQDIIWNKPNPMPESVQDRCTKAHEYVFLLSKSPRYCFDAAAIAEPVTASTVARLSQDVENQRGSDRVPGKTNGTMKAVRSRRDSFDRSGNAVAEHVLPGQSAAQHRPRVNEGERKALRSDIESRHRSSIPGGQSMQAEPNGTRNKRSVWAIATQPFGEAHFATMAPELAETCIKAGCPAGGTVLDPFGGAGTTGLVADQLQRNAVLIELNPVYAGIAERRIRGDSPLFAEVAA